VKGPLIRAGIGIGVAVALLGTAAFAREDATPPISIEMMKEVTRNPLVRTSSAASATRVAPLPEDADRSERCGQSEPLGLLTQTPVARPQLHVFAARRTCKQMGVDKTYATTRQFGIFDVLEDVCFVQEPGLRQSAQHPYQAIPVRDRAECQFGRDHRMLNDASFAQGNDEIGLNRPEVVYPDRAIDENQPKGLSRGAA
jgi:hypothetical protein